MVTRRLPAGVVSLSRPTTAGSGLYRIGGDVPVDGASVTEKELRDRFVERELQTEASTPDESDD